MDQPDIQALHNKIHEYIIQKLGDKVHPCQSPEKRVQMKKEIGAHCQKALIETFMNNDRISHKHQGNLVHLKEFQRHFPSIQFESMQQVESTSLPQKKTEFDTRYKTYLKQAKGNYKCNISFLNGRPGLVRLHG